MLTLSKKILVVIDGSPQSDKAAEEAIRLAAQSGAKLRSHVFAVLVMPSLKPPPRLPTSSQPNRLPRNRTGKQSAPGSSMSWRNLRQRPV